MNHMTSKIDFNQKPSRSKINETNVFDPQGNINCYHKPNKNVSYWE